MKDDVKEAAGPLQICAGQNSRAKAAIYAMGQIFENESSVGVLLIDAKNAFNSMNREVALHNVQILCPTISMNVINTYRREARLFIAGRRRNLIQRGDNTRRSTCNALVLYQHCHDD